MKVYHTRVGIENIISISHLNIAAKSYMANTSQVSARLSVICVNIKER